MGYQDDYVMRTISDLVRAIARLALGKNEINYALPDTEDKYSDTDRIYRKLRDLVDAGQRLHSSDHRSPRFRNIHASDGKYCKKSKDLDRAYCYLCYSHKYHYPSGAQCDLFPGIPRYHLPVPPQRSGGY